MARRPRTLRFKLLLAFALLVVVGWSVLWFVAATVVDRQVERIAMLAEADGALLKCANRSVKGFPFRIEVRCGQGSRLANAEGALNLDGLTIVGLVYNPSLVIAEVRSPVSLEAANTPRIEASWDLAHASARLDYGSAAVDRFDAEVNGAVVTVGGLAPVSADAVHLNARRQPEAPETLDVAARLVGAVPLPGGAPVDVTFRGSVPDGAPLLAGRPEALVAILADGGLPLVIDSAAVSTGGMTVVASGTLTLKPNGRIDGALDVAMAGADGELPYASVLAPEAAATVAGVLRNVLAFAPDTTVNGERAKKISLTIRDGRVSAGFVPLFTVPAVEIAGL